MSSTQSGRTLITSKPSHGGSASNSYPPQSTCRTSPLLKAHSRTENIARHKTSYFPFFFLTLLHRHRPFLAGRALVDSTSRSVPCPMIHELSERDISKLENFIFR